MKIKAIYSDNLYPLKKQTRGPSSAAQCETGAWRLHHYHATLEVFLQSWFRKSNKGHSHWYWLFRWEHFTKDFIQHIFKIMYTCNHFEHSSILHSRKIYRQHSNSSLWTIYNCYIAIKLVIIRTKLSNPGKCLSCETRSVLKNIK